jgi:hypothetical protein
LSFVLISRNALPPGRFVSTPRNYSMQKGVDVIVTRKIGGKFGPIVGRTNGSWPTLVPKNCETLRYPTLNNYLFYS